MIKLNKKFLSLAATILSLIWLVVITISYFGVLQSNSDSCSIKQACINLFHHTWEINFRSSHDYYITSFLNSITKISATSYHLNPIYLIFGLILFIYLANFAYDRFVAKKKQLHLQFTPLHFLLFFTAIFAIVYIEWVYYFQINDPIRYRSILLNYPILLGEISLIILTTLSIGQKIKQLFLKEEPCETRPILPELLFSFGFGMIVIVYLLFFIALFGQLKGPIVWAMFGLLNLIAIKQVIFWLKQFFTFRITIQSPYFDVGNLLALLVIVFLAHNVLELIRPIPIGFDDMSVYINNPHLMAQTGHLLSGIMSYPWELFTSLGFVLYKSMPAALMITLLSSIFGILGLYYLVSTYCQKRGFSPKDSRLYTLLCVAIFYTLPTVVFQSAGDVKVDLAAFFFGIISILAFWQWRTGDQIKLLNKRYLWLSALLAGFAFSIKYTSLLFFLALLFYIIYIILKNRQINLKQAAITIGAIIFIFLLPSAPIFVRNIYQTKALSVFNIRFGKSENPPIILKPPLFNAPDHPPYQTLQNHVPGSAEREEIQRFFGFKTGISKYLLAPLSATLNNKTNGQYVDIGFLFLAFVPLIVFFYKRIKIKQPQNFSLLLEIFLVNAVFWLSWLFLSAGVIWYGLIGFAFLLLILIETYHQIRTSSPKYFLCIANFLIALWITCALFLRTSTIPINSIAMEAVGIKYARGNINEQDYLKAKFGDLLPAVNIINQDIRDHPDNPPKVLRVGTFLRYLIDRNDVTVLDDNLLDKFNYASQDNNDAKMLERLKNSGFKYIIFDNSGGLFDQTPEKTLLTKYKRLRDFINHNQSHFKAITNNTSDRMFILQINY